MSIKLFSGTTQADFNEAFNVTFSVGDIRNLSFGSSNKSYTLNLPLTKTNKALIKYVSQIDVKSEPSDLWRLYVNEILVIAGKVKVLSNSDLYAKIIITADTWIDDLAKIKLPDLDLSADNHTLTNAHVSDSWSASYPVYRYPMIDFGGLQSGENGPTATWYPTDFIPMISIAGILTKMLAPYTIVSNWLATTFIKNLFILGKEVVAEPSFIQNKALEVSVQLATDNQQSGTSSSAFVVTFSKQLQFATTVKDEASRWIGDYYSISETGTYKFKAVIVLDNTAYGNANVAITGETVVVKIEKNGSEIASITAAAYSATELIDGVSYEVVTPYIHCEASDEISVNVFVTIHATPTGSQTIVLSTAITSTFESIWGNPNRYAGLNKVITIADYLPNMTQVDFLAAIRDIFNLRFWMDGMKRNIYIEPWDSFVSSTVIDLTDLVDHDNPETELISQNYSKYISLYFKDDTSDAAYEEYLKLNLYGPGRKDITLTSLFADPEIDNREHQFSSLIEGYNLSLSNDTLLMPRIWNKVPVNPFFTFDRNAGFNTRIVEWKGLTAGLEWNYDGTTKTTYPKIQGLDFASLYNDYWQKLFHFIDKGKIRTVRIKIKPSMLNQFFTVVDTAASEAFRPIYKIDDNYYFLQKMTTDGHIAELELILR